MNALPFEFKTLRSSQAIESHRICQYFVREDLSSCSLTVWRAGEAWPRSGHTGSSLPDMLWGKSPCLGAESATGRPEGLETLEADSDATCGVVVLGLWSFAAAKLCREHLQKCQQNGAHSLHALLLQLCHTWVENA